MFAIGGTGAAERDGRSSPGPGWLLPALLSAYVLFLLRPDLLLTGTTPTGYDLGAHVLPLHEMSTRLLPSGRIQGWSQAWFAGVPLYYFYFPLPAVLVGILDVAIDFDVAVKIVSVSGVLLTPPAAWLLARGMGMRGWAAGIAATGAGLFLFQESVVHLGGNARAALAGEFSYALAFPLALAYLGVVAEAARGGTPRPAVAALLLASCALSHVVPAGAAVAGSLPLVFRREARRTVLFSWGAGFLVSAVWSVPFVVRSVAMPDVDWNQPLPLGSVLPPEVWPLLPAAVVGVWLAARRGWGSVPLLGVTVATFGLVLAAPPGGSPYRLVPFWLFILHFLAAWPVAVLVRRWRGDGRRAAALGATLAVVGFAWLQIARSPSELREWATWNYEGYEAKERWPEFDRLVTVIDGLPPGRVYWEDHPYIQGWGTPHAPALIPLWSPEHPVLGGLWTPFQPTPAALDVRRETSLGWHSETWYAPADVSAGAVERGVEHMRMLGVRWFVSFSSEVRRRVLATPGTRIAAVLPFATVVELRETGLVAVADRPVRVWDGEAPFEEAGRSWFLAAEPGDPWLAEGGPEAWPRVTEVDLVVAPDPGGGRPDGTGLSDAAPTGTTRVIEPAWVGPEEIRFRTDRIGVPHLVRVSWFANWRAHGADGPWRVAPSFMIVVPTAREVRLSFERTGVEWAGAGLSLLGLLLVTVQAVTGRRSREASSTEELDEPVLP